MPKLILSPVGTSLLTNNMKPKSRSVLYQHSNKQEDEIPDNIKSELREVENNIQQNWDASDISNLKKISAELNGILGIYENNLNKGKKDIHFLLATDTYQGKLTAELLKEFLSGKVQSAQVIVPKNLNTKTKEDFKSGIRDLLKWCEDVLPGYKDAGYEIIFNLTGGFKSLQGYLNTIGMFYADSISYIFEGADELISIPKLPVKIETEQFQENATLYLQLSQTGLGIKKDRLKNIPETFIEEYDQDRFILSDWGELSWNKVSKDILSKMPIELPYLEYEASFIADFNQTKSTKNKIKLQETLGKISCILQETGGNITALKGGEGGGILYDNYSGKNKHLGHFRIGQGPRVSCQYENQILKLRHYGEHDYVNDNP